jgi:hypothetical protein
VATYTDVCSIFPLPVTAHLTAQPFILGPLDKGDRDREEINPNQPVSQTLNLLGTMKGKYRYNVTVALAIWSAVIMLGSTSRAAAAAAASSACGKVIVDSSWRRDIIGVRPTAWNTVLLASGRLALMDMHDLYVRDASRLLVRGGASGYGLGHGADRAGIGSANANANAIDPRQPHVSVATAWSKRSQSTATQTAIGDAEEKTSPVSNKLPPTSIATVDGKASPGSVATSIASSPSLLATTLAAIWSLWNILNGTLLTFTPKESYDVAAYLVEAIGVVRLSHGLQLFLSAVASFPSKMSMGVAILPRLLFLLACLGMKTYQQLGIQTTASPMVFVSAGVMSATAFALLSDKGRPNLMANIFSTMTFAKGCSMMFRPDQAAAKVFGIDGAASSTAANLVKVPAKVRSLGFHLMISAVFTNALTHSINPIRAAGYSAATWFLLLADVTFAVGQYRSLGAIPRIYLFFLASALSCSIVFLTDAGRRGSNVRTNTNLALTGGGEGDQMIWEHSENMPLRFDEQPAGNEYVVEEVA